MATDPDGLATRWMTTAVAGEPAPWPARQSHGLVWVNGRLLLLGGFTTKGSLNDVWSSADGKVSGACAANAPPHPEGWLRQVEPRGAPGSCFSN